MSRLTGKAEIIRAALDSIVYQITDIVKAMEQDTHMPLASLRTDGGPIKNSYLMQFQRGILGTQVEISQTEELSFCGAAFVAGMAVSLWDHRIHERIQRNANRPIMDAVLTEKVFRLKKAVEATLR